MAEITTTQSFSDGDTVTATKLNNIQGNASIQPEAITNRSAETSIDQANDLLLVYDASATALKKVSASNLIKAGTASDFPITGNATIGGTLAVTGNSTLAGTLGVTGNSTLAGTLGVTGNSTLAGTLGVTGNTTIGGTLGVTGAITATSTINGTTIPATKTLVTTVDTQTLTNKTLTTPVISSISNTGTITLPTTTDTLVGRATTDTLTNKTLTAPIISSISNTGTLTLPNSTDTLVGRATTDTLTNKTLTSPVIATITNTGTITLPTSTDTLVGRATTDTLTNKTLTSPQISGGTINNAVIGGTTAVAGSFTTLSATSPITTQAGTAASPAIIPTGDTNTGIFFPAADTIAFSDGGTERLRIASAGQIGIGGANYGTSGQALVSNGASSAPSWQSVSAISRATAVAASSGAAVDFTSIPSGVKRITVILNEVSTTGVSDILVQIGDSGGIENTGYLSSSVLQVANGGSNGASSTDGFIWRANSGANVNSGLITIVNISGNIWIASHSGKCATSTVTITSGGGSKTLSDVLDRVRITLTASDTFDGSGTANILYES
jgi:hypothetical protein